MSNVIKAYTVCYDKSVMKTIDSRQTWKDKEELLRKKQHPTPEPSSEEGFISGIKATLVKELPTDEDTNEDTKHQSKQLLENASKEAAQILDQAKEEASRKQKEIYEEAKAKGYQDGMAKAQLELKAKNAELDHKLQQIQQDYENMVKELEPQIAGIIATLVEKITGIMANDHDEVILHLVEKALKNLDQSDNLTLRVSKEDYNFINAKKEILLSSVGREIEIQIIEDSSLMKNQCLIETDLTVINCGLDEQLKNLITDIKLLGGVL